MVIYANFVLFQVRLSHPSPMDLILRKRVAINIYKKQSLTNILKKKIGRIDSITTTGVMYEIVSNVPKASEELEDRESLAQLAASGEDAYSGDGETYIEKYTKSVGAVESILTLDRLRQNLAVKELLQNQQGGKVDPYMKKTLSVPNLSQLLRWQEENSSSNSTGKMGRSESLANFAAEYLGIQNQVIFNCFNGFKSMLYLFYFVGEWRKSTSTGRSCSQSDGFHGYSSQLSQPECQF